MGDADRAWRESEGQDTIEVTDPATNTVWSSVPIGNEDDVNAAVEAAHAAFTTGPWSKTTPTVRAEIGPSTDGKSCHLRLGAFTFPVTPRPLLRNITALHLWIYSVAVRK